MPNELFLTLGDEVLRIDPNTGRALWRTRPATRIVPAHCHEPGPEFPEILTENAHDQRCGVFATDELLVACNSSPTLMADRLCRVSLPEGRVLQQLPDVQQFLAVEDGRIFAIRHGGDSLELLSRDLRTIWSAKLEPGARAAEMLSSDRWVAIETRGSDGRELGLNVYAADSGKLVWRRRGEDLWGQAAIKGNYLAYYSREELRVAQLPDGPDVPIMQPKQCWVGVACGGKGSGPIYAFCSRPTLDPPHVLVSDAVGLHLIEMPRH